MSGTDNANNAAARVLSGAMALFGSPGSDMSLFPAGSAASGQKGAQSRQPQQQAPTSTDDIPKEELLHLCMKMNKRMQAMETKGSELVRRQKLLTLEKKELLAIIRNTLNVATASASGGQNNSSTGTAEASSGDEIDVVMLRGLVESNELRKTERIRIAEQALFSATTAHKAAQLILLTKYNRKCEQVKDLQQQLEDAGGRQRGSAGNSPSPRASPMGGEAAAAASGSGRAVVDDITAQEQELIAKLAELQGQHERLQTESTNTAEIAVQLTAQLSAANERLEQKVAMIGKLEEKVRALRAGTAVDEGDEEGVAEGEGAAGEAEAENAATKPKIDAAVVKPVAVAVAVATSNNSNSGNSTVVASLQRQLQQASEQLASLQLIVEEKEHSITSLSELVRTLKHRMNNEVLVENNKLRERTREVERQLSAAALMKAEQDKIVDSLRKDLRRLMEDKAQREEAMQSYAERVSQLEGRLASTDASTDRVSELENLLSEKTALVTRLRSDAATNERNYALKATILASYEVKLADLREEVAAQKKLNEASSAKSDELNAKLRSQSDKATEDIEELRNQLVELHTAIEATKTSHDEALAALAAEHKQNIDAIQKESNKRAALARTVIQDKEEEILTLQGKIRELQQEIASGAPGERKILALAELQAKRDLNNGVRRETQDLALQQIQLVLASKDFELAALQQKYAALSSETLEMQRSSKREGVSMDYLKNVVFKFMTYPIQSPERASLLPVIAMLLQFSDSEKAEVAKNCTVWMAPRTAKPVVIAPSPPP